jgi:hypothetical protein
MPAPPEEIVKILAVLGISVKTEKDLFDVLIHRDDLLRVDIEQRLAEFVDSLKEKYKSSMLNCLHKNRETKQKFPAINLIRQILKCNGYQLKPLVFSKGYSKHNGKKLVERNFKIVRLGNFADIKQTQQMDEHQSPKTPSEPNPESTKSKQHGNFEELPVINQPKECQNETQIIELKF